MLLPAGTPGCTLCFALQLLVCCTACPVPAARVATVSRQTKETSVKVTINLDGTGKCHSKTQVGFVRAWLGYIWCLCAVAACRNGAALALQVPLQDAGKGCTYSGACAGHDCLGCFQFGSFV